MILHLCAKILSRQLLAGKALGYVFPKGNGGKRMFKRLSISVVCLAVTSQMALAQQSVATVGAIKGVVLVNRGGGFVSLSPNSPLSPGDRVMAKPGGKATAKYADGCPVQVKPGATVLIGETSPCNGMMAQAGGAPPPPPSPSNICDTNNDNDRDRCIAAGLIVAGAGAAIGGGIYLATQNNGGGGRTPISP